MTATRHSETPSVHQPFLAEPQSPQSEPQPPQYIIVLPPYPHPYRRRLLRKSRQRSLTCCGFALIFLIAAGYLLWPSDPDITIVRLRLDRLHIHTSPAISLDVVLDLSVRIRNRDFFSVEYDSLIVGIAYRGNKLGTATSGGGRIKARGSSDVNATLRLDGVEILTDAIPLVEDLAKGAIPFDSVSQISGKIGLFFFELPIKAKISCEVIVNTPLISHHLTIRIAYSFIIILSLSTKFNLTRKMKTVAVTGGSGFIGTWMLKTLLDRGYTVRASVRDINDPKETDHLMALDGAKDRLTLMEAELLDEGAFDELLEGCDGVFHMASPFFFETKDPQTELLDPAVKGTLNVLNSVIKVPSIRRVVLTSSEAAVAFNGRPLRPDVVVDETWWSDADYCRKNGHWYLLSKLLAEQAAWEFAKEKGIDLVTICPAAVIGPMLQPVLNTSCGFIRRLINGSETYVNETYGFINVKDVVNAHILAYETPSANGRYLMVESTANNAGVVKILKELYPDGTFPEKCADDKPLSNTYQVSKERALSIGVKFTPLKESIKETVESLKARGFA